MPEPTSPATLPVTLRVARTHGGLETFRLAAGENTSVLDLLFAAQREHDRSLVFRSSCRIGVCGSCAVRVNGREALACRTRARDVGPEIALAPLRHLPVVRDLAVDLVPFRAAMSELMPALSPSAEMGRATRPRAPVLVERAGGTGDCITCAICYSAAETVASVPGYPGPAAFIRAAALLEDPRDGAQEQRRAAVRRWLTTPDDPHATEVCPKGLR
ncbi:MAG: 2Fe-2S iron-sulfur cluster binding domain-containing protein, partial [Bryobacteraceae bacterium]|nr:2Fe-2S iron-sulfur cluster binding domain-containing protein [Bryobacteraceae bacterium]